MSDLENRELAEHIVGLKKTFRGELELTVKPQNNRYHVCEFRVEDDEMATIPKIIVAVSLRVGFIPEECLYNFTVFWQDGGRKYRAYQLEVCPPGKRSHNGGKASPDCYGPHEHVGGHVEEVSLDLGCPDHQQWFEWFCKRVNLTVEGSICPPFGESK